MRAWTRIGAGALLLSALSAAPAMAQGQVGVSVAIGTVLHLSAAGSFTFPAATDAEYMAGSLGSTAGPTLTHRANVPYQITIQAQSGSTLGFANAPGRSDPNPNKATTQLELRATTGGTPGSYVGLAAAGGAAAPFYTRSNRGSTLTSTVDARLLLSYANDPPGTYSTTVVFTIVAQ